MQFKTSRCYETSLHIDCEFPKFLPDNGTDIHKT